MSTIASLMLKQAATLKTDDYVCYGSFAGRMNKNSIQPNWVRVIDCRQKLLQLQNEFERVDYILFLLKLLEKSYVTIRFLMISGGMKVNLLKFVSQWKQTLVTIPKANGSTKVKIYSRWFRDLYFALNMEVIWDN